MSKNSGKESMTRKARDTGTGQSNFSKGTSDHSAGIGGVAAQEYLNKKIS